MRWLDDVRVWAAIAAVIGALFGVFFGQAVVALTILVVIIAFAVLVYTCLYPTGSCADLGLVVLTLGRAISLIVPMWLKRWFFHS